MGLSAQDLFNFILKQRKPQICVVNTLLGRVLREVRETAPCVRHPHPTGAGEGWMTDRGADAAACGGPA